MDLIIPGLLILSASMGVFTALVTLYKTVYPLVHKNNAKNSNANTGLPTAENSTDSKNPPAVASSDDNTSQPAENNSNDNKSIHMKWYVIITFILLSIAIGYALYISQHPIREDLVGDVDTARNSFDNATYTIRQSNVYSAIDEIIPVNEITLTNTSDTDITIKSIDVVIDHYSKKNSSDLIYKYIPDNSTFPDKPIKAFNNTKDENDKIVLYYSGEITYSPDDDSPGKNQSPVYLELGAKKTAQIYPFFQFSDPGLYDFHYVIKYSYSGRKKELALSSQTVYYAGTNTQSIKCIPSEQKTYCNVLDSHIAKQSKADPSFLINLNNISVTPTPSPSPTPDPTPNPNTKTSEIRLIAQNTTEPVRAPLTTVSADIWPTPSPPPTSIVYANPLNTPSSAKPVIPIFSDTYKEITADLRGFQVANQSVELFSGPGSNYDLFGKVQPEEAKVTVYFIENNWVYTHVTHRELDRYVYIRQSAFKPWNQATTTPGICLQQTPIQGITLTEVIPHWGPSDGYEPCDTYTIDEGTPVKIFFQEGSYVHAEFYVNAKNKNVRMWIPLDAIQF